jgi:hypothetical protein
VAPASCPKLPLPIRFLAVSIGTQAAVEYTERMEGLGRFGPEAVRLIRSGNAVGMARVDVLITTVGQANAKEVDHLARLGVRVSTVAGRVLAADMPVSKLAEVVRLSFVGYIEVAAPIWPEKGL